MAEKVKQSKPSVKDAKDAIMTLVTERGPLKTICPSEAARRLDPIEWRSHMDLIRTAAADLVASRALRISKGGQDIKPHDVKGPIRLGLPGGPNPRKAGDE